MRYYSTESGQRENYVRAGPVSYTHLDVYKRQVYGCQFHPEKSGHVGLSILKAFCELEGGCEPCAPESGCGPNGAGGQSGCGRPESGKEVRP